MSNIQVKKSAHDPLSDIHELVDHEVPQGIDRRSFLMRSAVEEVLRFESSNQLGNRRVVADTVLGGVPMREGDLITIGIAAANRDPRYFPDPDRFDVGRTPNKHLAFASGIHVCAGMNVARLEGRIALERFLARFPDYRLDGAPIRSPRARFRGFISLSAVVG